MPTPAAALFAAFFVLLYVAHLVADYALQTDHQAAHKAQRTRAGRLALAEHAAVHAVASIGLLAAGGWLLDLDPSLAGRTVAPLWLAASHALIDLRTPVLWWMRRTGSADFAEHGGAAHVDQTAHIALGLLPAALALALL
jgi:hypothetical protein